MTGKQRTVYQSVIEICLQPVFEAATNRNEAVKRDLLSLCERYSVRFRDTNIDHTSQAKSLIGLFCMRFASHEHALARENGYIGSYHNCGFKLLYGVFGVDILAYLFDEEWVPNAVINPFQPELFLERLSVFERAAAGLTDGARTPLPLLRTSEYFRSGMGPRLPRFNENRHRLLLAYSLGELRGFGELGRSLRLTNKKPIVEIKIWSPYDYDDEILRFASEENRNAEELE
jgi:hypothetical protein